MSETSDIKKKAIKGGFWQFAQKMLSQAISLFVGIVLARLLSPTDYGLVAMTTIFISVAGVFASSGLGSSLVQKKEIDLLDCDTVFWAGLGLSAIIFTILFFCAPLIAAIYNNYQLIWIIRAQSVSLLFSSFSSVQGSLVSRKLDFKAFFYLTLISTILSGIVGLSMAFAGFGVWALIGHSFSGTIVSIITLQRIVKWCPRFCFSFDRLKKLWGFGLNLMGANLFGTFFNELRGFLIGIRYTPADLAYYNRGNSIPSLFDGNIRGTIASVLFPAMSRLQNNPENIKISIRRSMMTTTFLIAPTMMILCATSEQLIMIVYTSKWALAIPFMQVVCFQFLFNILGEANLQAMNAIGRSDVTFKLEFIKKPIYLAILLYTMTISPLAMAIGNAFYGIIGSTINATPNKHLINYSYIEQIKDVLPQILLSIVVGIIVYIIGILQINIIATLLLQFTVGISLYLALAYLLRLESLQYLLRTIKEMRNERNK